jgi:hypothetical protein
MTLRDSYGEVTVPFGQLFTYENATLEVVCPDSEMTEREGQPVICVRLVAGFVERNGQRFGLAENGHHPRFGFTAEFVASMVRAYRITDAPAISEPARPQQPAQTEPKERRTRKSNQRTQNVQPITENLF